MKRSGRQKTIHSRENAALLGLLIEARHDSGLTQVALSRKLGMTQSALSKYERGELRLDVVQTRRWCQAVGMPFLELMQKFDRTAG